MTTYEEMAAEIREMPRCLRCGGCGWYNEMGPNTFPLKCACRWLLFDPGCGECYGTGHGYDGLTCRCG